MFVIICVVVFITHGSVLFSQRFGIDTDFIMNGKYNFHVIGREGLIWLAWFLGLKWFNLYYAQVLTLLFMAFAPVVFGYLFYQTNNQNTRLNLSLLVLSISFIVSPFWTAQIYFLNQSAQVLFACILIPVCFLLAETTRTDPRHKWYFYFGHTSHGCYLCMLSGTNYSLCYRGYHRIYIVYTGRIAKRQENTSMDCLPCGMYPYWTSVLFYNIQIVLYEWKRISDKSA